MPEPDIRTLIGLGDHKIVSYQDPICRALVKHLKQATGLGEMLVVAVPEDNSRVAIVPLEPHRGVLLARVGQNHRAWGYFDAGRYCWPSPDGKIGLLTDDAAGADHIRARKPPSAAGTESGNGYFLVNENSFKDWYQERLTGFVQTQLASSATRARELILAGRPLFFRDIQWDAHHRRAASLALTCEVGSQAVWDQLAGNYLKTLNTGLETFVTSIGAWIDTHLITEERFTINGTDLLVEYRGNERFKPITKKDGRVISINGMGVRSDDLGGLFRAFLCCASAEDVAELIRSTKELPLAARQKLAGEWPVEVDVPYEIRRQFNLQARTEVPLQFVLKNDVITSVIATGEEFPIVNKPKFLNWCARAEPRMDSQLVKDIFGHNMWTAISGDIQAIIAKHLEAFERSRILLKETIEACGGRIDKQRIYVTGDSGNEYNIRIDPDAKEPPRELNGDGHLPVYIDNRSICIVCRGRHSMGYDRVTSTVLALRHDVQVVGQIHTLHEHVNAAQRRQERANAPAAE
jgi:hypothetical protein